MTKMDNNVNLNEVSRISAGTVFKGELSSPTDMRIDGTFEGRIVSKGRVVVGDKAIINGDVVCQNADFSGSMNGNFFVKDTLCLKGGCTVNGDLHIKRLQVELDARFNGHCSMIEEADFDRITGTAAEAPEEA